MILSSTMRCFAKRFARDSGSGKSPVPRAIFRKLPRSACGDLTPEIDPSQKGIIGPFALQGAVVAEDGKEDIVIFDVSFRIPGSPGTFATPYTRYLYGESISVGERIGMELRRAVLEGRVEEVVT